jgi:hypothetical protein
MHHCCLCSQDAALLLQLLLLLLLEVHACCLPCRVSTGKACPGNLSPARSGTTRADEQGISIGAHIHTGCCHGGLCLCRGWRSVLCGICRLTCLCCCHLNGPVINEHGRCYVRAPTHKA